MKVRIESHTTIDKSFIVRLESEVNNFQDVDLRIDYDDVNHPEVDAIVQEMKETLETHWDNSNFLEKYRTQLIENWIRNREMQEDWDWDINNYLKKKGFDV